MNIRINLDNYEEYALEYADGELREPLLSEMERFLAANPAIKREILGAATMAVEPNFSVHFPNKRKLYKPVGALLIRWGVVMLLLFCSGVLYWATRSGETNSGTSSKSNYSVQDQPSVLSGASQTIQKEAISNEDIQHQNVQKEIIQNKTLDKNEPVLKLPMPPLFNANKQMKNATDNGTQQDSAVTKPLIFANAPIEEAVQKETELMALSSQTAHPQAHAQVQLLPTLPKLPEHSHEDVAVEEQPSLRKRLRDALLPEAVTDNSAPKIKTKLPKIRVRFD